MSEEYLVFSRVARNWEEFARANKRVIRKGLTKEEARDMCIKLNENMESTQRRLGLAYEFCPTGSL